jgi:hypothetical protein
MRRTTLNQALASLLVVSLSAPLALQAGAAPAAPAPAAPTASAPAASAAPTAPTAPPAASSAAPAGDDAAERERQATEHFMRGVKLTQEKAWDAALAEFEESIRLLPKKSAVRNAAICLRELGRYDEALLMWERLVSEFGAKLSPEDRNQADQAIAELKTLTGYLIVTSNVEGATVVVNGHERGKTPLKENVLVPIGTSIVKVSKEGYATFEGRPRVVAGPPVAVDARLDPLARAGRVTVVEEKGLEVSVEIDGAIVGKTPYSGAIAPGQHVVILKGEGNLGTQPASVIVEVDKNKALRLSLEPLESELRVEPDPITGSIVLDGVPITQGVWEGRIRSGKHIVDVSGDGYFSQTKQFEADKGKKVNLKVKLDRDENSPFWTKGRRYPISVALVGDGVLGRSFNGDYEGSCTNANGKTNCYARTRPWGFMAGARGGYEFLPGFAVELELGYAYYKSSVSRQTVLYGEQQNPVNVDIQDNIQVSGPYVGVGVAYAFIRRPFILSGGLTAGAILSKTRERREGTAIVDDIDPGPASKPFNKPTSSGMFMQRPLSPSPQYAEPVSKAVPFFVPEIRLAIPIGEQLQIGLGLGAVIVAPGDVRPKVSQAATPTADWEQFRDKQGAINPIRAMSYTPGPAGSVSRPTGFTPQKGDVPDSAIGTFILGRASVFVKFAF